jgi:hypothetical protein
VESELARAFDRTAAIFRSASGSGSKTPTSQPFSMNRAAQPPPITPPPMIAAFLFKAYSLVLGFMDAKKSRFSSSTGSATMYPAAQVLVVGRQVVSQSVG